MQPAAMQPAAMQPTAMQPTAMPHLGTHLLCRLGLIKWVIWLVLLPLLMHWPLSFLTRQTPVGSFLRGSKCCKISFFKSGNSLRLGKLVILSLKYLRYRFPHLFHRNLLSLRKLKLMTTLRLFQWGHPVLRGLDPEIRQGLMSPSVPGPVHHATSRRSLSPHRDYSRGTSTVTRSSQASPKHAEDRPVHAQDLEVF